jgi:hypothetical protein
MRQEINSFLKRIDLLNHPNEDLVIEVMKFISNLLASNIADNEEHLGILFYRSVSKLNQDSCSSRMAQIILEAFENIKAMSIENQKNSELRTIYFLQKLYSKRLGNGIELSQANLEEEFKNLLENLEQIRILFKLKISSNISAFPISHLLFDLIKCNDLLGELNYVKTIQTLMLALQIFNSEEYNEEFDCIKNIIEECNLTFASYLLEHSERIGGKEWIKNYEKNGVLVLYNPIRKKVLIRSIREDYFNLKLKKEYGITTINSEKNRNKDKIAYYVEYELDVLNHINIFEELKKNNNFERMYEILSLLIDDQYYNIWTDNSLILFNGKIQAINPFCNEDKFFINKDGEIQSSFENVLQYIKKFLLNKLVGNGINYLNLGMVLEIEKIERVELSYLDIRNSSICFNQLIKNWISYCKDKQKSFNDFLRTYTEQLSFVQDKKKFIDKEYEEEFFLPYQIDEQILELLDFNEIIKEKNLRICVCEEDFMNGNKKILIKETQEDISSYKLQNIAGEENDIGIDFLAIIDEKNKILYVGEEIKHFYQLLDKIRKTNENMLSTELLDTVSEIYINGLSSYMKLHQKAWFEIHTQVSLESIVRYRLANHLLLFDFNKDKFNRWYKLINKHEKVDYSIISTSTNFDINKNGVLFVLKDRSRAQSTFKYINYEYINSRTSRDKVDLFDPAIDKNEDGVYIVNGEIINEICFVFDVIQYAGATKRTMKYYLDEKSEDDNVHMQIYVSGKRSSIFEVLKVNSKVTVTAYAIYASDEGVNSVNDYLKKSGYEYIEMKREESISSKLDDVDKQLIQDIYKRFAGNVSIDEFLVIREFNQPKHNIVSQELLIPEKICSLFVKRKEI